METTTLESIQTQRNLHTNEYFNGVHAPSNPSSKKQEVLDVHLSMRGQFMQQLSGLSDEEKDELRAFRQEMREAVESGTFDAEAMAQKAPDALKNILNYPVMDRFNSSLSALSFSNCTANSICVGFPATMTSSQV